RGTDAVHRHEMAMKAKLLDGFATVPGLRILSPPAPGGVPVVTVKAEAMDAATLAGRLDREHDVQTRSGLHCAPEVHRILGTLEEGAVRFSLGWASTAEDVETAVEAVDAVLRPTAVAVV
ncbi:MAG: aminotransferase class V-fold PLP-dependent enzyme, partial [Gemmatimonadetes bacterium]|nr:aminotransferase class V-fold PLP-dependent enzyme [Gemmatimonadota bacterium]